MNNMNSMNNTDQGRIPTGWSRRRGSALYTPGHGTDHSRRIIRAGEIGPLTPDPSGTWNQVVVDRFGIVKSGSNSGGGTPPPGNPFLTTEYNFLVSQVGFANPDYFYDEMFNANNYSGVITSSPSIAQGAVVVTATNVASFNGGIMYDTTAADKLWGFSCIFNASTAAVTALYGISDVVPSTNTATAWLGIVNGSFPGTYGLFCQASASAAASTIAQDGNFHRGRMWTALVAGVRHAFGAIDAEAPIDLGVVNAFAAVCRPGFWCNVAGTMTVQRSIFMFDQRAS